jgi:hypothetical protein
MIFVAASLVLTYVVMLVEQQFEQKKVDDVPDLRERSVGIYFALALFSSVIILPIYFYVRRGPIGVAIGIGLAVAVAVISFAVTVIFSLL